MVGRFKRSESEDALDARIAVLSARRSVAVEAVAAPVPVAVATPEVEPQLALRLKIACLRQRSS